MRKFCKSFFVCFFAGFFWRILFRWALFWRSTLYDYPLLNIDLLMVNCKIRSLRKSLFWNCKAYQQRDHCTTQCVISKFRSEQTMEIVQLNSTIDDVEIEVVGWSNRGNRVKNWENGVQPEDELRVDRSTAFQQALSSFALNIDFFGSVDGKVETN